MQSMEAFQHAGCKVKTELRYLIFRRRSPKETTKQRRIHLVTSHSLRPLLSQLKAFADRFSKSLMCSPAKAR